jgi:hypothetical protein
MSESLLQSLEQVLGPAEISGVQSLLVRLEKRLKALPERSMRRAVLVERVNRLEAPELVVFLSCLQERTRCGLGQARKVLQELALEPHVFNDLPYDRVQEAYRVAQKADLSQISTMFLSSVLEINPTINEAFTGNDHMDLPLGIRRSAARGRDRYKLDRLMHDRDHRVIANLLENPLIVERDVIRIAAMRPTRPEVLSVIAAHRKWASRYRIRKALACNPYTPGPISLRLLPTLLKQDLRIALEAGVLPQEMLGEVRKLIRGE